MRLSMRRLRLLALAAAVVASASAGGSPDPTPYSCSICLDQHDPSRTATFTCTEHDGDAHSFCLDGMRQHVQHLLASRAWTVPCPNCKAALDHQTLAVLAPDADLFARWQRWHLATLQGSHSAAFQCPSPDCPNLVWSERPLREDAFVDDDAADAGGYGPSYRVDESGKDRRRWFCEVCDRAHCLVCARPWLQGRYAHDQRRCADWATIADGEADRQARRLLERDSEQCPQCGSWIYRYEGCAHLTCTICMTEFHSQAVPSWSQIVDVLHDIKTSLLAWFFGHG